MEDKDKKSDYLFNEADKIKSYFSEDEERLDTVFENLSEMEAKLKEIIDLYTSNPGMRGTQKSLSDEIANFISIQTQKQSLLKDKRAIKENALNIALKNYNGEGDDEKSSILNNLVTLFKNRENTKVENEENIDEEISKRLEK